MNDHNAVDAGAALSEASRAERRIRAASRWFASYLLLMGVLAVALVVAVEVFFPSGGARFAAAAVWALAVVLLSWWAESHDVYPKHAARRLSLATAVWFGAYLVAIGPFVRWQAGTSPVWWSVAAAVLALPFLAGAWWERRRS